jgi:hypothetical protein
MPFAISKSATKEPSMKPSRVIVGSKHQGEPHNPAALPTTLFSSRWAAALEGLGAQKLQVFYLVLHGLCGIPNCRPVALVHSAPKCRKFWATFSLAASIVDKHRTRSFVVLVSNTSHHPLMTLLWIGD